MELSWSGEKRETKEGGEGVLIAPPPKVTVVCVFCEVRIIRCKFGSSGRITEYAKTHSKTSRSGSSGHTQNSLIFRQKRRPESSRFGSSGVEQEHPEMDREFWAQGPDHPAESSADRLCRPDHPANAVTFVHKCFLSETCDSQV